jgi:hypothetical protein
LVAAAAVFVTFSFAGAFTGGGGDANLAADGGADLTAAVTCGGAGRVFAIGRGAGRDTCSIGARALRRAAFFSWGMLTARLTRRFGGGTWSLEMGRCIPGINRRRPKPGMARLGLRLTPPSSMTLRSTVT